MQTMQNEFRYNCLKGKPFYCSLVIPALVFQFNLHLTNFIISSYQVLIRYLVGYVLFNLGYN